MSIDEYIKRERAFDAKKRKALTEQMQPRKKIAYNASLLFLMLLFPVSAVHELGHASICALDGHQFRIWFDVNGGNMACFGKPVNQLLFSLMGGAFGMAVTLGPIFIIKKRVIMIALLALGISQGVKMFLEGFATSQYLSGSFSPAILIMQFAVLAVIMFYFLRRHKPNS